MEKICLDRQHHIVNGLKKNSNLTDDFVNLQVVHGLDEDQSVEMCFMTDLPVHRGVLVKSATRKQRHSAPKIWKLDFLLWKGMLGHRTCTHKTTTGVPNGL